MNNIEPIPVVIFARKSTADPRGSIPRQVADCREAIEHATGRSVVDVFPAEARSAYRGEVPELQDAKRRAAELAAEHGTAELWVQHSDRIARGDGLTADHLAEVYFATRKVNVRLRSVQDDGNLEDVVRAVLIGERNNEDSKRKSQATTGGLAAARMAGHWLGGHVPDGYRKLPKIAGQPAVLEIDPQRAPTVGYAFSLGFAGMGTGEAARTLIAAGLQSGTVGKHGVVTLRPFDPHIVRKLWRSAHHAGLVRAPGDYLKGRLGEVIDGVTGDWPALVDPADWWRLQAMMDARGAAQKRRPGGHYTGKTSKRHLLARLGVCGLCGESVHSIGDKVRKDGTTARRYHCSSAREAVGTCTAPRIIAEAVERPFLNNLAALTIDLHGWVDQRRGELDATREAWEAQAVRERRALDRLEKVERQAQAAYERHLIDGEDDRADVAADTLARLKRERLQAQTRLAEVEAAAAATPDQPDPDALLDLYRDLQDTLKGRIKGDSVGEVNARLREALERIVLTPHDDGSVGIKAYLSEAFLAGLEGSQDGFAAVSAINGGPTIERDDVGLAALFGTSEAGVSSRSWPDTARLRP